MGRFLHMRFLRNPSINISMLRKRQTLKKFLFFGYFDLLDIEESDNIQDCAFGNKQSEYCEAYQSLGLIPIEPKESVRIRQNLVMEYPISHGDKKLPFISVFHLTMNPFYFKYSKEVDTAYLFDKVKEEVRKAFDANRDHVFFNIYQTVNAIDFCIIVATRNLSYSERLSNNLKRLTFSSGSQSYLLFTVYENIGIYKEFDEELIKESFSNQHALITRIRVTDDFWNGLEGNYIREWDTNCRCSILSGRYHFSARIETPEEILSTLKEIIAFKFGETIENIGEEVNIVRRMIMEGKVEYINERILYNNDLAYHTFSGPCNPSVSLPVYQLDDEAVYTLLEDLHKQINTLAPIGDLAVYWEKLENFYFNLKELSGNPDTHISCKMCMEYYEAFLNGFKMMLELVMSTDNRQRRVYLLDELIKQLKVGLRYLMQFLHVICSINTTTFHAPKYEMIQDMNASPKFAIAYTQFLREHMENYRFSRINADETELFPYYIPLIIPKMTEVEENFFMTILCAQGFTDNWLQESDVWKKQIASKAKTPLYVVCQKYKTFANISHVLVLSFHEMGHYCNYLTRKKRNSDLLQMVVRCLSERIILAYRDSREAEHFLNRTETIQQSRIKHFRALNVFLEKEIFDYLQRQTKEFQNAPEELFICCVIQKSEALFSPEPSFHGKSALRQKAIDFVVEKTRYHFGNKALEKFTPDRGDSFDNVGKQLCNIAFENCSKDMDRILNKFGLLEVRINALAGGGKIYAHFGNYMECTKQLAECALINQKMQFSKLKGDLLEYSKAATEIKNKIKAVNPKGITDHNKAYCFQRLLDLYIKTFNIQELIHEYWTLKKVFWDNSEICMPSVKDGCDEKNRLVQNVCQKMMEYLRKSSRDCNNSGENILASWERQMLARLQLSTNMEKEPFCTMLSESFFRVKNIERDILSLSRIYSEGFADLSMCRELSLNLKEYLTAIAKYVKYEAKQGDDFRLSSITIVVIVKLLKNRNGRILLNVHKKSTGRKLLNLFEEETKKFLKETPEYADNNFIGNPNNEFAQKFQELIAAIKERILPISRNTIVFPMIERMAEHIDSFGQIEINQDIRFVKDSLNYCFLSSFGSGEQNLANWKREIQRAEIVFMMKYYYQNRKRYMSERDSDDKK